VVGSRSGAPGVVGSRSGAPGPHGNRVHQVKSVFCPPPAGLILPHAGNLQVRVDSGQKGMSEPKGGGGDWTEERRPASQRAAAPTGLRSEEPATSDEGRRCMKGDGEVGGGPAASGA